MSKSSNLKKEIIEIQGIRTRKFLMTIKGISPLLCHRRSPEGIRPNANHEFNEEEEFNLSLYPMADGKFGFPASGLKKCATTAAGSFLKAVKRGVAQGSFFIPADYVEIISKEGPHKRLDVVIIQGKAVVRTRAQFDEWEIIFPIEFSVVGKMTVEQLVGLFNVAGSCVGLGDWRPNKNGIFGRFQVTTIKEITE